jgi:hypothetical protein
MKFVIKQGIPWFPGAKVKKLRNNEGGIMQVLLNQKQV